MVIAGVINCQNTPATTTTDSSTAICAVLFRRTLSAKNLPTIVFMLLRIIFRLSVTPKPVSSARSFHKSYILQRPDPQQDLPDDFVDADAADDAAAAVHRC